MLRLLLALCIFFVWMLFARNYYLCEVKGICIHLEQDVDSSFMNEIPSTLNLYAGDSLVLENYPEFYFDNSSHTCLYLDGNEKFLALTAEFLKENPKTVLHIQGLYLMNERSIGEATAQFENIGMARAIGLADKLFVDYKVGKEQLKCSYILSKSDSIQGFISFSVANFEMDAPQLVEEDSLFLQQINTSIQDVTYSDQSAQFAQNSSVFRGSETFDIYVDSLLNYLKRDTSLSIRIIGHTDGQGSTAYNQRLGLQRAVAVKDYLELKGIRAEIITESKGEEEPLETEKLEYGGFSLEAMQKNRRVNIKIE